MVDQESEHLDMLWQWPALWSWAVFLSPGFLIRKRKLKNSVLGWSPGAVLDLPCELGWVPLSVKVFPYMMREFSTGVSVCEMVGCEMP